MEHSAVLGPEFEQWQSLTDLYEQAIQAMGRNEPGARERAKALAQQVARGAIYSMAVLTATTGL